jgi:hypothetical protein
MRADHGYVPNCVLLSRNLGTGDNTVPTPACYSLDSCLEVLLTGDSTGPLLISKFQCHNFQFNVSRMYKKLYSAFPIASTGFLLLNSGA